MSSAKVMSAIEAERHRKLFVRVGLEGKPKTIKLIPRAMMTGDQLSILFERDVAYLQEEGEGRVVWPRDWPTLCAPPPTLYFVHERTFPELPPDVLEESEYRGTVQMFALHVPSEVDAVALTAWLNAGLDDDDPEQVAAREALEEREAKLKEINKSLADLSKVNLKGRTLDEELEIRERRVEALRAERDDVKREVERLRVFFDDIHAARASGSHSCFTLFKLEDESPFPRCTWEVHFERTERGERAAYIATHKLNWQAFRLGLPRRGVGTWIGREDGTGERISWDSLCMCAVTGAGRPVTGKEDKFLLDAATYAEVNMREVVLHRMQHGQGMFRFQDDRGLYSGGWYKGLRHGLGVELSSLGKFTGRFVQDWKRGRGVQVFANGDVYRGPFNVRFFHPHASLLAGMEYAEGRLHGRGRMAFVDGSVFEGEFRDGRVCGAGEYWSATGAHQEGKFGSVGVLHGEGISTVGDLLQVGTWRDGQLHGKALTSDATLGKYQGTYRHGLEDGHGRFETNGVTLTAARYRGWWRHGARDGRGFLDWGDVNRDEDRAKEKLARMAAATAGKTGAAREAALELAKEEANKELSIISAANQALEREGLALTRPGIGAGAGAAAEEEPWEEDESEDEVDRAVALTGDNGEAEATDGPHLSEYDKFDEPGKVRYHGDRRYEGRWRHGLPRTLGCFTDRKGRAEAHHHERWFTMNTPSSRWPALWELSEQEMRHTRGREATLRSTFREILKNRIEAERMNLKSYEYWNEQAAKSLDRFRRENLATKAELFRLRSRLAAGELGFGVVEELRSIRDTPRDAAHHSPYARASEAGSGGAGAWIDATDDGLVASGPAPPSIDAVRSRTRMPGDAASAAAAGGGVRRLADPPVRRG